jgi:hypothetical protein
MPHTKKEAKKLGRHCPTKSWGWEEWIVNDELYCGKQLHFTVENGRTSMHFHAIKRETMLVASGRFRVELLVTSHLRGDKFALTIEEKSRLEEHGFVEILRFLEIGESIDIPPLTPHRIVCARVCPVDHEAILIEFSTHHRDDDSYRIAR